MAELAASIIGIVSAGTKVTLVLSQLAADVGSAGKEARMIANEIRSFCAVVKTLGDTLEKVQTSAYYAHCADMTRDMTQASLAMFTEILDATESMINMSKSKDGKYGLVSRVQWAVFQKPKIAVLRAAMEAYKSNLALMLGTLNTAEKVTRRMSLEITPAIIAEEQQDRSLLQSLELDQRASMLNLEEAELLYTENPSVSHEDGEGTSPPGLDTIAMPYQQPTEADGLVYAAREEIESIRSSLFLSSQFDTTAVRETILRLSRRLSQAMTKDQGRISQRWSTVLTSDISATCYKPQHYPPYPAAATLDSAPSSKYSEHVSTLTEAFAMLSRTVLSTREQTLLSEEIYSLFRCWLLDQHPDVRRITLERITKDVLGSTPNEDIKSSSSPKITTFIEQRIDTLKHSAERRLHAQEILKIAEEEMQATNVLDKESVLGNKPGVTIDLGKKDMDVLPHEVVDVLRDRVERLALNNNYLRYLPATLSLCSQIRFLDIRANEFEEVPTPIFALASLEILNMSRNRIRELPRSITQLRSLKVLSVDHNEISTMPYFLANMENLVVIKYRNNPIIFPKVEDVETLIPSKLGNKPLDVDHQRTKCLQQYLRNAQQSDQEILESGNFSQYPATPSASTIKTSLNPSLEVSVTDSISDWPLPVQQSEHYSKTKPPHYATPIPDTSAQPILAPISPAQIRKPPTGEVARLIMDRFARTRRAVRPTSPASPHLLVPPVLELSSHRRSRSQGLSDTQLISPGPDAQRPRSYSDHTNSAQVCSTIFPAAEWDWAKYHSGPVNSSLQSPTNFDMRSEFVKYGAGGSLYRQPNKAATHIDSSQDHIDV